MSFFLLHLVSIRFATRPPCGQLVSTSSNKLKTCSKLINPPSLPIREEIAINQRFIGCSRYSISFHIFSTATDVATRWFYLTLFLFLKFLLLYLFGFKFLVLKISKRKSVKKNRLFERQRVRFFRIYLKIFS